MSNPNATASAFGWDFQANLGLYLVMDDDLTQVEKFKIEGNTEDIEIYYRNNTGRKPLFIQAKAQENPYSDSTTAEHLNNAIMSLLRVATNVNDDYDELIYGTNIEIPIRARVFHKFFEGDRRKFRYSELPESFQKKLDKIINDPNLADEVRQSFKDRLSILKVYFYGQDDESRYGVIKRKVVNKLISLGIEKYKCNRIFEFLQKEFIQNASKRIDYSIEEFGLTIILLCIESDENQSFHKLSIPEEFISRIKAEFSDYISDKELDFQFISQLVGDYKKHALTTPTVPPARQVQDFVIQNFNQYKHYFLQKTLNVSQELIDCIIKVTLYRILLNRYDIDTIKERFSL